MPASSSGHHSSSGGAGSGRNAQHGLNTIADGGGASYHKPKGVIDAVSEIQQFYVFESRADEDLPYDFFTFRQVVDFFSIGFKGALLESLFFLIVFPLALTVYPAAKAYFFGTAVTTLDLLLPYLISYGAVIGMTLYMVAVAKYYKAGVVTRKAIHSLFTGRSAAFVVKGFVGWYLLMLLFSKSLQHPDWVYRFADSTTWLWSLFLTNDYNLTADYIYVFYFRYLVPAMEQTASDVLLTMLLLAAVPFTTIFLYGGLRVLKRKSNKRKFENY